ncbi:iron-containing alcohol dehydrogenase [Falsirhodobacter xinxiangensis]|uniref:iron-containing alcohol dehydrogenase n=1 Tax=Falsirhodobacter xinxiangensis TaxID=2530049 RepID=UPI0010AA3021|nr:iron-containing alcohol dehydrogenase [Rhodobacter xinxiangensis]
MKNATMFGVTRAPANLIFGAGQRHALGDYAAQLGRSALVVTDARMAGDPEMAAMRKSLEDRGVAVTVFSEVEAELPLSCIAAGVVAGQGAEVIVGIGGGSCLDAAKVIALLLKHGGQASDYYGEYKVPGPVLPLIVMPTTSGTGSEATPVAVLADEGREMKIGISSPFLIPHTSICDPELTLTCPPGLTAASGADALTHAIEALTAAAFDPAPTLSTERVFVGRNTLSDAHALEAIRHISANLRAACKPDASLAAREGMMMGATLAGLAFGSAGTAAAHAIQYPVGALTHTPHGIGVAVMMPYVMAFNRPACEPQMAAIAAAMGASDAVEAVARLFADVGIPRTLADLGITPDQLPQIAEKAFLSARLVRNNPRPLGPATMLALVEAAFEGRLDGLDQPILEMETI